MASGTIQRKDIITDDALQFGQEFANNVNIAIESVETMKKSALGLFNVMKQLKDVNTQSGLDASVKQRITITNQATQAYQNQNKALDAIAVKWKEQDQLEKNLISTKKKNELATESTNRALIEEKETLRLQNLEIKRSLTSIGQLTSKRDQALRSVQEFQARLALGKTLSDQEQRELQQSTAEFQKYDKAVKDIKTSTNQYQEFVGKYPGTFGRAAAGGQFFISTIKKLIPVLGLAAGIRLAFNFAKESRQLAIEAKGVEFAFQRLGDIGVDAFERVKKSTRGVLSDLDIKKALVDFDNFNISLEETDTLFEFLAVRAAQTGKSVDELQSSLVEGLSKESKLRIDNLGISATELNKELEKTPNFVQAVANIAKREVAEAGDILDKAGNSQARWNAEFENFQLQIGKGLVAKASNAMYDLGTNLLRAITPSRELTDAVKEEQLGLNQLVSSIIQTNENEEKRKLLIEQLNEQYPFFNKFIKDEDTNNQNLKSALREVNELYIKRLAIRQLEKQLDLQGSTEKLGAATRELTQNEIDYQKALSKINLKIFKGDTDNIRGSLEETNDVLKDLLLGEEVRLTQLQDKRTKNDDIRLNNIKKAREFIQENEKILNRSVVGKSTAETQLENIQNKIKEFEEQLGLSKEQIEGVFDDNPITITFDVSDYKDKQKEIDDLNEQLATDKYNLSKAQLESDIRINKDILDNEKSTFDEKLKAALGYFEAKNALLELERKRAIAEAKNRTDVLDAIEINHNNTSIENENEYNQIVLQILDARFQDRLKAAEEEKRQREQATEDRIRALKQELILELEASGISGTAKLQRLEAFEKLATEIRREESLKRTNLLIEEIQKEIAARELLLALPTPENDDGTVSAQKAAATEQLIALRELLRVLEITADDEATDNALANIEKQAEAERKLFELKTSIIRNASQTIADSLNIDANSINALFDSFLNKAEATGDAVIDKYNEVQNTLSQIGAIGAVTGDILNSVFEANIDRIDEQIEASEEFYNRQFELAQGDVDQQNAIRAEQELKKQELEKKKRKEEEKAAKFAKGFSIFNIGITTAQAVIAALAPPPIGLGPLLGQPLAILAGALGALQVAAVLAKPIPKYEHGAGVNGRPVHPGGPAEVAEGNRAEIVHEPGKKPYVQHKHAVLNLSRGTTVYPNYDAVRRAAIMTSLQLQSNNINQYEALVFDNNYDVMVQEQRRTTEAIKKLKLSTTVNQKNMDIDFELFKYKNLN